MFLISALKFESVFRFVSSKVKKWVEWFFVFLLTWVLLVHSFKWSVAQTELSIKEPPRNSPFAVYSSVQDEIYKNVVVGAYCSSWVLIILALVLYFRLSRRKSF